MYIRAAARRCTVDTMVVVASVVRKAWILWVGKEKIMGVGKVEITEGKVETMEKVETTGTGKAEKMGKAKTMEVTTGILVGTEDTSEAVREGILEGRVAILEGREGILEGMVAILEGMVAILEGRVPILGAKVVAISRAKVVAISRAKVVANGVRVGKIMVAARVATTFEARVTLARVREMTLVGRIYHTTPRLAAVRTSLQGV